MTRPAEPIPAPCFSLLAAVAVTVVLSGPANAADPPSPRSANPVEEAIDDVGLWKSTVEPGGDGFEFYFSITEAF